MTYPTYLYAPPDRPAEAVATALTCLALHAMPGSGPHKFQVTAKTSRSRKCLPFGQGQEHSCQLRSQARRTLQAVWLFESLYVRVQHELSPDLALSKSGRRPAVSATARCSAMRVIHSRVLLAFQQPRFQQNTTPQRFFSCTCNS